MKYYVYDLLAANGDVVYVGKGSGRRLAAQKRNRCLAGNEVARFWSEDDAYAFEVERIAELRPILNVHPGGNGPRGDQVRLPDPAVLRRRVYRLALNALVQPPLDDPSRPWASALSRALNARAHEFAAKFAPEIRA